MEKKLRHKLRKKQKLDAQLELLLAQAQAQLGQAGNVVAAAATVSFPATYVLALKGHDFRAPRVVTPETGTVVASELTTLAAGGGAVAILAAALREANTAAERKAVYEEAVAADKVDAMGVRFSPLPDPSSGVC